MNEKPSVLAKPVPEVKPKPAPPAPMVQKPVCPRCGGAKVVFVPTGRDTRVQMPCPQCQAES